MTLEQKIGQMMVCGWTGETENERVTVSSHARILIEELQVGGIIFFKHNIADDLRMTVQTINDLQAMSAEPLLMGIDQEGGMVARITEGVTVFPSNMAMGATGRSEYAYQAAAASGKQLAALGFNCNFAPNVDVNNNPDNPIIGTRSYGESPDLVAEFGAQAIRGYQDSGVIACAKHFPGHGDTSVDSHLALPTIPYDLDRLNSIELKPFRAAVNAGVSSIMTTHIMFPVLDTEFPATLSPKIVNGLLRTELGYDSVVVTDGMEMHAIAQKFGTPGAAVLAIEAGVDIVLVCGNLATQRATRSAILEAVKDGRITEQRIDESVARIDSLKRKHHLNERRKSDTEALSDILCSPQATALQREIARESVKPVVNRDGVIPFQLNPGEFVLVVGMHETVEPIADAARKYWTDVKSVTLGSDTDSLNSVVGMASRAGAVIVPTCSKEPWKPPVDQELQAEMVNQLLEVSRRMVVVAVRDPYDIRRFPNIGTYICTYGYRGGSLEAAVARMFE